ncbi:hypothetical protein AGLY_002530 [Aphis glycines]|uniref:Uncharacterized protein n=1 Tax=Aphis glycines TaxID=307491 RepID=A0A6G0U1W9_APHGL|nr:hypothetical protein AGLY_002530 [Aphis glycines]
MKKLSYTVTQDIILRATVIYSTRIQLFLLHTSLSSFIAYTVSIVKKTQYMSSLMKIKVKNISFKFVVITQVKHNSYLRPLAVLLIWSTGRRFPGWVGISPLSSCTGRRPQRPRTRQITWKIYLPSSRKKKNRIKIKIKSYISYCLLWVQPRAPTDRAAEEFESRASGADFLVTAACTPTGLRVVYDYRRLR